MQYDTLQTSAFYPLWKKYRPVILKLMIDSKDGPQTYSLSKHEFTDLAPKKNIVYSFKMEIFQGKPLTPIKTSLVAQDFVAMLKQSLKANELMETITFNFELDKQFVLQVTSVSNTEESEEENTEEESE